MTEEKKNGVMDKKVSRRNMLKMTGIGAAGIAIGASGMGGILSTFGKDFVAEDDDSTAKNKVNFYGKNQPGITTPAQSNIYFASLTVLVKTKEELQKLFKDWTPAAVKLMNGEKIAAQTNDMVPPPDTGEAKGMDAQNLTLTFGVGPSLFKKFDFGDKKPAELKNLPHFPKDQIEENYSHGDICIQACADDAQVAFHAIRNLVRIASGRVTMKWSQAGFNAVPMTDGKPGTPRNLFAFKDGTENPRGQADADKVVFAQSSETKSWLVGGSYLIARRIQMHLETWDRTALDEQEATFGRHRDSGAPIGKTGEFDAMEIDRKDEKGELVVPDTSHVFLAKSVKSRLLRRSFSYASGVIDSTGAHDAGLLFISFQKDPKQFIEIQNSLGRMDKMNEYITHRGSAVFACFPGVKKGSFIGEALFSTL
ncbi:peroxidase [Kurthia zopfii]|uniref:Deferrochelatase n=1 Tax=Kurthia zopfii TaxID=1650 RepID=A0A2U3AFH9_9BACL|nr:iron uptake transporter deferrochelatase/peroxidase subunit [Kurthia zopfii]PWI23280.1 deferrochelatase/peroxidase EfeB [Kurthia zopfii]TDR42143.1 deferrochelatase/peroxidase EfeB [Kurthia zopfii]STX10938.1 Probable deferrochelatase/peroxidase EfeN precursor [Kurthia zopfii]VEI05689.1 Probable deferrochelatase/peroxidase EfeN precursor [Kurthia zopfii]GEK29920.1 peroxidase [Kurthia zopfii]